MVSLKRLILSFSAAFRGISIIIKEEQSFRIQIIVTIIAVALMTYFHLARGEVVILALLIILVLVLELLNSVFERIIDVIKPRMHSYVAGVKDILAGTVLIASLGAMIVGAIIFWPYIFSY